MKGVIEECSQTRAACEHVSDTCSDRTHKKVENHMKSIEKGIFNYQVIAFFGEGSILYQGTIWTIQLRSFQRLKFFKLNFFDNKARHLFILFLLNIFSQVTYSESFSKLWGAVTYFGHYNALLYTIEPQIRLIDRTDIYEQFLLNAGIGTAIKPRWQLWLGQTYVNYAESNDIAEDVSSALTNEYRIWEQAMWQRPFFDALASRTRLEQRHAFQNSAWAVRFRERVYGSIPLNKTLSLTLSDEFFLNLNSVSWVTTNTLDQNRFFVGFFYNFTPTVGMNITYMNQFINKTPSEYNNGLVLNLIISIP